MERVKILLKRLISLLKSKNVVPIYERVSDTCLLNNRRVVITGGSGGIGLAIARKFIEYGAKVVITGLSEEKLQKCCEELGPNSDWLCVDMNNVEFFDDALMNATTKIGPIDTFVCSSGIHYSKLGYDFMDVNESQYDQIMSINLKGPYFFAQSAVKFFRSHKIHGHILFISSQSALEPAWSPYRLSKHGLEEITKGIAQQSISYGIVVNGIGPGPTATSMQGYSKGDSVFCADTPLNRYTMPEEVAEFAAMMVSPLGDTIVGDTLYMSGGRGLISLQ